MGRKRYVRWASALPNLGSVNSTTRIRVLLALLAVATGALVFALFRDDAPIAVDDNSMPFGELSTLVEMGEASKRR